MKYDVDPEDDEEAPQEIVEIEAETEDDSVSAVAMTDSLVGHAIRLLENHAVPFGEVPENMGHEDASQMIPENARDAIAAAMVSACGFLARTFDAN